MIGKQRWQDWVELGLGIGLVYLFFSMMAPFIVTILLGGIVAILCYPMHKRLTKYLSKGVSALVLTFGLFVGIFLPITFVMLTTTHKLLKLVSSFSATPTTPQDWIHHPWIQKPLGMLQNWTSVDESWIFDQAGSILKAAIQGFTALMAATISGIPGIALGFVIVFVSTYFFLVDGERFLLFLRSLSPLPEKQAKKLYETFQSSCRGVVLGLILSALVQAAILWIFMMITGVPNAFLLANIVVVTSLVPLVGSVPVSAGAALYLFANGHVAMGIVMSVGSMLAGISDNIVRPLVLKGSAQLHPMLALISVFGAIQLMGATGIFLGPIIAAVFVAFLQTVYKAQADGR